MSTYNVAPLLVAAFVFFTLSSEVLSTNLKLHKGLFATLDNGLVDLRANASDRCNMSAVSNGSLLKYADALGKPEAGLALGNRAWWGSYSECKTIPDAHYCLANVVINLEKNSPALSVNWGICVPKECDRDSLIHLLHEAFAVLNSDLKRTALSLGSDPGSAFPGLSSEQKPVVCAKNSEYTTGVIVTLTLCGTILFLCCVGTVLEIILDCLGPQVYIKAGIKGDGIAHDSQTDDKADRGNTTDTEMLIPRPRSENTIERFFLCFSLIRNTSRIMDTKVPSGAITSINGMRVLSMWWVILGHTYLWSISGGNVSNITSLLDILHRFTFQGITGGEFAVDTFFFLSGLLSMYLSMRLMANRNGKLPLFQFYFHRFWRLTPTYMFVLLFYDKLTGFLGDGPMWFTQQVNPLCDKYWWTNLLYINNFYPTESKGQGMGTCMGWSWYLANDMQFYVISPVVLYSAYWFGVRGLLASAGSLLAGCFISTAVIIAHYNIDVTIGGNMNQGQAANQRQSLVYVKPYCRIAPYVVGLGLGYFFHNKRIISRRLPLAGVLVGWCVAIVLGLSTVYGRYNELREGGAPFTKTENVLYGTFSRFAWGIAIAWVTFICHRGIGGLVNRLLSASFWIPLSRLTYTAYLVHPIVLYVFFASFETLLAYSDVHLVFYFCGVLVVTYMAAFAVSVSVEYPMMQMEKILFKTNR